MAYQSRGSPRTAGTAKRRPAKRWNYRQIEAVLAMRLEGLGGGSVRAPATRWYPRSAAGTSAKERHHKRYYDVMSRLRL